MRLLVASTDPHWSMSTRLLMTIAHGLAEREATVVAGYPRGSATADGLARSFPALALRSMEVGGTWTQWSAMRSLVAATRPGVMLVSGEQDALLAALSMGRRGGVVRRLRVKETLQESWRTGLAERRSRITIVGGEHAGTGSAGDTVLEGLAWPAPVSGDARLHIEAPQLVIVPPSHPALAARDEVNATAVALRAAAHLRTRHPTLGVTLVGDESALQSVRIHAASLDLIEHLRVQSVDTFLGSALHNAVAVWVVADGDAGAICALSAMWRSAPVIVPAGSASEALVAPRISGFVSSETEPSTLVADLARLMSDTNERALMGRAAAARAARLYDWSAFLDRITAALLRASGAPVTANGARRAPSPA